MIPDFTEAERESVESLLHRRYGRPTAFGGGRNRQGERLIVAEVVRGRGQAAADRLVAEPELDRVFGMTPGKPPGPAS
ncbi:hypothetical protein BURK1_00527 [Burkholderiales bacterium]|nr:hypothetical protein BURK1_00527 [Burkholderiales bacterium]